MKYLKPILLSAFLYAIFGRLALMLAIPPGYVSPIWPSAGIALAFLLRYGYRILPGILLGSFSVNLWASFDASNAATITTSLVIAISIGIGATLQGAAGLYLINRYVSHSIKLINFKETVKVYILGAILPCVINPTIGVVTIVLTGIIPFSGCHINWITWWLGDTIGVFLFLSVTLVWIGRPREDWIDRRFALTVPLIAVLVIVAGVFYFGYGEDKKRLKTIFDNESHSFANALEYKVREFNIMLDSVQSFFNGSDNVSRSEFKEFLQGAKKQLPEINSVAWAPLVDKERVQELIDSAKKDGITDYVIKEIDYNGNISPVKSRPFYFPILYIEPLQPNKIALGIDNASESNRFKTVQKSIDSGLVKASAPIILGQDRDDALWSLLMMMPVFHDDNPSMNIEDRRKQIHGFVTITTQIHDFISGAQNIFSISDNLQLDIYDIEFSKEDPIFTRKTSASVLEDSNFKVLINLDVAGRTWLLSFKPSIDFFITHQTWTLWFLLVMVLLISSLFNLLILFISGRATEVSRLVKEKTRELLAAKKELEKQIKIKEETAQKLIIQADKLMDQQSAMLNLVEDTEESRQESIVKELEIQKKAEELTQSNKELDAFAYTISHDLRAPLRTIISFATMVKQDNQNTLMPESINNIDRIINNGHKMNSMMEEIIDFSRIGRIEKQKERVNLNLLLKELISVLDSDIQDKKAIITFDSNFPTIECYKERVSQIFMNLIGNSLKYVRKDVLPQIHIGHKVINEQRWFFVKDNGIGIKENYQKKIFDIFSRLHADTKVYSGSGIGLSNVKKIVDLHGGEIYVESKEGDGASFYFHLGHQQEKENDSNSSVDSFIEESNQKPSQKKPQNYSHSKSENIDIKPYRINNKQFKHLVVVDDDTDSLALFSFIIKRSKVDFTFSLLSSGEEAIDYVLGQNKYKDRNKYPACSVMLLDINMPKISGFEVLENIRNHVAFKNMPFIAMFSSSVDPKDKKKSKELGANVYITKTNDHADLIEKINKLFTEAHLIYNQMVKKLSVDNNS